MKTLLSVLAVGWCGAVFAGATVEYEQFGAKGDGKTDDRAAIIAAHEAANRLGASVRAKDGATYYVASDVGTAVVKTDIAGTAKSYTAYVWDASVAGSNKWAAMDGNYSAENVYFKNDISCAGDYTQVGNISKSATGTYTLPASG